MKVEGAAALVTTSTSQPRSTNPRPISVSAASAPPATFGPNRLGTRATRLSRRVSLTGLRYVAGPERADILVDVQSDDAPLLAAQVRRAIGVLSADVTRPAVVAVAS